MTYTSAANTQTGKRKINQDSYVCLPEHNLWLVADGVGGLSMGESASAIASYTLATMIASGEGVNQAIESAHRSIQEYGETEGKQLAAAMVLILVKGNLYNIYWAGDCRVYLFDKTLKQLTRDHTHSQYLIDQGQLTEKEALTDVRKDGLTKALGVSQINTVNAGTMSDKWSSGQKVLLCSDGLSGYVSEEEICGVLNRTGSDQDHVDQLVELALRNGSLDNITAILVSAPILPVPDSDDTEIPRRSVLASLAPQIIDSH